MNTSARPALTVAAVAEQDGRFLLVEEVIRGRRVINQPAGHVECGEELAAAVVRETLEETTWHFAPEAVTGIYLWQGTQDRRAFLRVVFCGRCIERDPQRKLDRGILRAFWLSREELGARPVGALRSPMVLRSIDDYLGGRREDLAGIAQLDPAGLSARAIVL